MSRCRFLVATLALSLAVGLASQLAVADTPRTDFQLGLTPSAPWLVSPDGGREQQKGNGSGSGWVEIKNTQQSPIPTTATVCSQAPQAIVLVGTTAAQVPTNQLAGRKTLRICVSIENAGSPKVKCLLDGTPGMTFTPDVGVAQGDVMAPGDCYVYPVDTTHTVKCISDTASTGVLTWEC